MRAHTHTRTHANQRIHLELRHMRPCCVSRGPPNLFVVCEEAQKEKESSKGKSLAFPSARNAFCLEALPCPAGHVWPPASHMRRHVWPFGDGEEDTKRLA